MRYRIAAQTDVGLVRTNNEDAYRDALPLLAVADGMGGPEAGEVASNLALEVLDEWRPNGNASSLTNAVVTAHRAIAAQGEQNPEQRGMGTTLTAAWFDNERITVAHVGDSRAYLWRAGQLSRLTDDQTVVHRWVEEGKLTEEEAQRHPYRSQLLQCLGMPGDIDVDVTELVLDAGDRFLLASDGLTVHLSDGEIAQILAMYDDPQAASNALIDRAKSGGGIDNITVVTCYADGVDGAMAAPAVEEDAPAPEATIQSAPPAPVIVTKPDRPPATAGRRSGWMWVGVAATAVLIALVAFLLFRPSRGYVVATSGDRVAILHGRPGSAGESATGRVVRQTDVPVSQIARTFQDELRTGIAVPSIEEGERRIAQLPKLRGPTETASPSPAVTLPPASPAP